MNRPRELAVYVAESKPHSESTHVDRAVEARARAMLATESGASAYTAPDVHEMHDDEHEYGDRPVLSGFGSAMSVRVRFMGGALPLWSLFAPVVIVAALVAALAASAASHAPASRGEEAGVAPRGSALASSEGLQAPTPSAARPAPARSAEGSPSGPDALELPAGGYTAKDVLVLASKRSARDVAGAEALAASLDRDPASVQEPRTLSELRRFAENPETAKIALGAIAKLPAPLAADLLYEVWTGTPERNDVTELARALLFSKDVRPKASSSLAVALDLRGAESCEQNSQVLPRAIKDGDRRSLHLLIKLQRKYGCGPNKRLDCYPCLRSGDQLEAAIKTAREHPEPRLFTAKR